MQSRSSRSPFLAQLETQTNEAHHGLLAPTTRAAEVKRLWPLRMKEPRSSGYFGFQRCASYLAQGAGRRARQRRRRQRSRALQRQPRRERQRILHRVDAAACISSVHLNLVDFASCGFRLKFGTAAMPAAATPAPRLRRCLSADRQIAAWWMANRCISRCVSTHRCSAAMSAAFALRKHRRLHSPHVVE